jgi:hypothetical protein
MVASHDPLAAARDPHSACRIPLVGRFYEIALGSVRECEAIVELLEPNSAKLREPIDVLARHVFKLVRALD